MLLRTTLSKAREIARGLERCAFCGRRFFFTNQQTMIYRGERVHVRCAPRKDP